MTGTIILEEGTTRRLSILKWQTTLQLNKMKYSQSINNKPFRSEEDTHAWAEENYPHHQWQRTNGHQVISYLSPDINWIRQRQRLEVSLSKSARWQIKDSISSQNVSTFHIKLKSLIETSVLFLSKTAHPSPHPSSSPLRGERKTKTNFVIKGKLISN